MIEHSDQRAYVKLNCNWCRAQAEKTMPNAQKLDPRFTSATTDSCYNAPRVRHVLSQKIENSGGSIKIDKSA